MKYVIRILGGLVAGILLFLTIYYFSDWDWKAWKAWRACFFIIVGWFYLIGTKFGFQVQDNRINAFYGVCCIFCLVIILGGGSYSLVHDVLAEQKNEQVIRVRDSIKNRQDSIYKKRDSMLQRVIDRGLDTTVYGIECHLKTRYNGGNMDYIFTSKFMRGVVDVGAYVVTFLDKDGFKVCDIEITSFTRMFKNNKIIGAYVNDKINLSVLSYESIDHFNVSIRSSN